MALRAGRLSLVGLGRSPALPSTVLASSSRRITTGRPTRGDDEEGPTIALGGPAPSPPPPPRSEKHAVTPAGPAVDAAVERESVTLSEMYADAMRETAGRRDGATPDRPGGGEGVAGKGDTPLLLSADAPGGSEHAQSASSPGPVLTPTDGPSATPSVDAASATPSSSSMSSSGSTSFSSAPSDPASSSNTSGSATSSLASSASTGASSPSASASPNASSDSADSQAPSREEWERKYEELQAAYHKKMGEWREAMDQRLKTLAAHTGETLAVVSQKVNEVTGYREVERLKQAVKDREQDIRIGRRNVREAKKAYEEAVSTLSSTQQSVNALLERKHSWTDADVANFTKLVRSDHASRAAVASTNEALKDSELKVDKAFTGLMQSILERYHEEQVWSDKIRSVSTWAQVAALVANLIVFVGAIAFIEPWKRRRLVQGLEERVSGMMGRVEDQISTLSERVGDLDSKIGVAAMTAAPAAVAGALPADAGSPAPSADADTAAGVQPAPPTDADNDAIAQIVGSLLSDALSDIDPDLGAPSPSPTPISTFTSTSPLEQVASEHADTYTARTLHWASAQLAHVAAPSPERDLAAASVVGVAAGAAAVGLIKFAASFLSS